MPFPRTCPVCGSKNVVVDYKNGVVVCSECGTVLDDFIIDSSPVREHSKHAADIAVTTGKTHSAGQLRYSAGSLNQATRLLSLQVSRRLKSARLRRESIYEIIGDRSSDKEKQNILLVLENKCIQLLLRRLKDDKLRQALLELLAYYLYNGEKPYIAGYAEKYSVEKSKLKRVFRRAIDRCLPPVIVD